MNQKAVKFARSNISNYPASTRTKTDQLIAAIVEKTSQIAVNRTDEVTVMQTMLNDEVFRVGEYDRKNGEYTNTHSPREEALDIVKEAYTGLTGSSDVEAETLMGGYMFSKKQAQNFIGISKDFIGTYLQSGRKMTVMSEPRGEATLSLRHIEDHEKTVPDKNNPGNSKTVRTGEQIKMIVSNKR